MTEKEQQHRHQLERDHLRGTIDDAHRSRRERFVGQVFGLAAVLGGLVVVAYAVREQQPWVAAAIGAMYLLGLVFLGDQSVLARLAGRRGRTEDRREWKRNG